MDVTGCLIGVASVGPSFPSLYLPYMPPPSPLCLQVFKFSQEGKLLLTLGVKLEPGSDTKHFCKPTKVAFLRDGTFFVSDGYCNR